MRSLQVLGGGVVALGEEAIVAPRSGEVLVRTVTSAICGSEMRSYRGAGHPASGNNGHEAAGEVVEVGPGVEALRVGDRVGLSAIVGCGTCPECSAGRYTWCSGYEFVSGMHAEYVRIAARGCHRLPDDIDWATGVLISGDGLGVPYHSLTKLPGPDPESVVVMGLGPVGLGSVLLHAHLGHRVIGVDLAPRRRELARELGADAVVAATSDVGETASLVRETVGSGGPDLCIEAAGTEPTLRVCLRVVRNGGTVILNGEQGGVTLSPSDEFIRRDITVSGAWFYHFSEFASMLALVRDGLEVSRLVTHRFPLEDAAAAYAAMADGITGKVLLTYPGPA